MSDNVITYTEFVLLSFKWFCAFFYIINRFPGKKPQLQNVCLWERGVQITTARLATVVQEVISLSLRWSPMSCYSPVWCRLVRLRDFVSITTVLPHTKFCKYSLYNTLLMMDRWGPKHVELQFKCWLKLIYWDHIVYLVGLYIYITYYNLKFTEQRKKCQKNSPLNRRHTVLFKFYSGQFYTKFPQFLIIITCYKRIFGAPLSKKSVSKHDYLLRFEI